MLEWSIGVQKIGWTGIEPDPGSPGPVNPAKNGKFKMEFLPTITSLTKAYPVGCWKRFSASLDESVLQGMLL